MNNKGKRKLKKKPIHSSRVRVIHILMSSRTMMMLSAFLFLLLQTNFLFSSSQQFIVCYNDYGNYTLNSTYANNLDTALSTVAANISISGFYTASSGSQNPDIAYVTALCRGDTQPDECRGCIQGLTTRLRNGCPNQRQAVKWENLCWLRYSNRSTIRIEGIHTCKIRNATNPDEFMRFLRGLLDNLRVRAANGGPLRKAAAGNVTANDFQHIFALVECTPDMSSDGCSNCLLTAAADIPRSCESSRGASILYSDCNLWFETYSFFNETRFWELDVVPQPSLAPVTPLPPSPAGTNNRTRTIIIVVVSVIAFVILAVFVFIWFRKKIKQTPVESHENVDDTSVVESLKYTLSTIKTATNDFSDDNKLGQGGFGAVHKGKLSNDQQIAVKRLSKDSGQGDQEFKNEVLLLAKLQHRNLVRLLGFCLEGNEKLLVYEFVQNASLDQFIFDQVKRSYLDWEKRYKIIGGIARGILYLHEDSQLRIIHRDLKPSNVLLDGAMNPKIADFGMARLFERDETQGNTRRIAGTFGYMAPEYAMHGRFSIKSDVFSFGVLVLEIISGQKNNNGRHGEIVQNLLSFAWKNWHGRTPAEIADPCLRSDSGFIISDMVRCIHIALLCVQDNAAARPTMATVVLMLNSLSITMAIPSEPAFFVPGDYGSNTSALLRDKSSLNSDASRNEASISELYPR